MFLSSWLLPHLDIKMNLGIVKLHLAPFVFEESCRIMSSIGIQFKMNNDSLDFDPDFGQ